MSGKVKTIFSITANKKEFFKYFHWPLILFRHFQAMATGHILLIHFNQNVSKTYAQIIHVFQTRNKLLDTFETTNKQ